MALTATGAGLAAGSVAAAEVGVGTTRTPAIRNCTVPNLVGVRLVVAQARLRSAGCRPGVASIVKYRGPDGVVLSQSIRGGRIVPTTRLVVLRVAR